MINSTFQYVIKPWYFKSYVKQEYYAIVFYRQLNINQQLYRLTSGSVPLKIYIRIFSMIAISSGLSSAHFISQTSLRSKLTKCSPIDCSEKLLILLMARKKIVSTITNKKRKTKTQVILILKFQKIIVKSLVKSGTGKLRPTDTSKQKSAAHDILFQLDNNMFYTIKFKFFMKNIFKFAHNFIVIKPKRLLKNNFTTN